MSLATPEKIRILQRKLYEKAKKEPEYRFYSLYDKVYRRDILEQAYKLAKANKGAAGVDGKSFEDIESKGLESWIRALQEDLQTKRYRPEVVRRVWIPKVDGGLRPLGIPTIRDRVVQTAAMLVTEPIFEADFSDEMYGYRPKRNAMEAVKRVHEALKEGYTEVVDADLEQYFESIPHAWLMKSVARRICDSEMLSLIHQWLKVPVEEEDETGRKRRTGGKDNRRGTPQGGVVSPMLANIYMNRFLKAWRGWKMEEKLGAKVVAYADDFVILSRRRAQEALKVARKAMKRIGLKLNERKTRVVNARQKTFDFLGYSFGPKVHRPTGRKYMGVSPSKKAEERYKERIRAILRTGNPRPWEEIAAQMNRITEGWARYFSYGTVSRSYWHLDAFLLHRTRNFLRRRHKIPGRGTQRITAETIFASEGSFEGRGLKAFASLKKAVTSYALA